jgi:hypothetical protein
MSNPDGTRSDHDEQLSCVLLGGFIKDDKRGLPRVHYLSGKDESEARKAIAKLLRSEKPLSRQLRDMLASAFDPTFEPNLLDGRQIYFRFAAVGRRRDHAANTAIAYHIYKAVKEGATVEVAVGKAIDQFEITREFAMRVWGRYRRHLEDIDGPLERPSHNKKRTSKKTLDSR